MKNIYHDISAKTGKQKLFSLLIDPEKYDETLLKKVVSTANESRVDYFFIGGSLISDYLDKHIEIIKSMSDIPVIIFPGNIMHISEKADALLFLSLISGRNPELLIGNHVVAAPLLKKKNIEVISTGYILIESGTTTSVEYMSNTRPIPADKHEVITATALAGEMIGYKMIYLESGSGAINSASAGLISKIKKQLSVPLIVGGGICSKDDAMKAYTAGADMIVVGNIVEDDISYLKEFASVSRNLPV
jgi:phosphoglycerol geranylgeranyltransferase